jgi:SAM-dependent methyltransferase
MKEMWDQRYAEPEFAYGKSPNRYLASQLQNLEAGKLLLPGEGEGRNAIYAASLGWEVEAFDLSSVAREKALAWARDEKLKLNYQSCGLGEFDFGRDRFDAVGLVYFHAPPSEREYLHSRVVQALKPGGNLIIQAFHTSQLGKASGGPQNEAFLFDKDLLEKDFEALDILELEVVEESLDEGIYHQGLASIINFVGQKN